MTKGKKDSGSKNNDFAQTVDGRAGGFFGEFWYFIRHNRRWWLTPVIAAILVVGLLVILGGAGATPFIYTLF